MYYAVLQVDLVEATVQVEYTINGTDEMPHIVMRVKTDQIGAKQTLQYHFPLWEYSEEFVGWKRNMVKIADICIRLFGTDHFRQ